MKYLCLVYLEEEKLRAVPDRECAVCGDGFRKEVPGPRTIFSTVKN